MLGGARRAPTLEDWNSGTISNKHHTDHRLVWDSGRAEAPDAAAAGKIDVMTESNWQLLNSKSRYREA